MALLISTSPDAQEKIIEGLCRIMTEHSEHSRKHFSQKMKFLADTPSDLDVVIASYCENCGHPEFGLTWHKSTKDSQQYSHPAASGQRPHMIGGLVFHSFSDNWGVHT